jgi:hypothetical protein
MNATLIVAASLLAGQVSGNELEPTPAAAEEFAPPGAAPATPIGEPKPAKAEPAVAPKKLPVAVEQPKPPAKGLSPVEKGTDDLVPIKKKPKRKAARENRLSAAQQVLERSLSMSPDEPLAGTPVSLVEAFALSSDRRGRIAVAKAYWQLSTATAIYNVVAEEYAQWGSLVKAGIAKSQAAEATALVTAAKARRSDAHLATVKAQQQLAVLLGPTFAAKLPLVQDLPLTGAYRMHFEAIFANQSPPPVARQVNQRLPLYYQSVLAHADAVLAAEELLAAQRKALKDGKTTLAALGQHADEARRHWSGFLRAVDEYNRDIADYAGIVAGVSADDASLVGMLIPYKPRVADASILKRRASEPRGIPTLAPAQRAPDGLQSVLPPR